MKNQLIPTLAFFLLVFVSCQKEKVTTPEMAQKNLKSLEDIKTNALQYKALVEKNQKKTDVELQILTQAIEKLKAESSQRFGNNRITASSVNTVINVPKDYPTLQLAVNNSQPGGKIFIKGTVSGSGTGSVLVNVPGLTIEGQGSSPTINGTSLMITATGVTVQNLKVNMATVISGTTKVKVMNSTISATNNTGAIGVLMVINSSNNEIKNCTIDGAYAGGSYEYGLFLDVQANLNKVENCTAKNTFGPLGSSASSAFRIDGANNSITNCTALNFSRGFSSFSSNSNNNKFKGCVANKSINDAGFVFFLPTQSNLNLENCTANNNPGGFGFFISGGFCSMTNCTANSNTSGNPAFGLGVFVLSGKFLIEKSTFKNNSNTGIVIYNAGVVSNTGKLEKNVTESNGKVGIYLFGLKNSAIIKNIAKNNLVCDFNQTLCSGNTITANNFGTSCTGL